MKKRNRAERRRRKKAAGAFAKRHSITGQPEWFKQMEADRVMRLALAEAVKDVAAATDKKEG